MHAHEELASAVDLFRPPAYVAIAGLLATVLFMAGVLPIPIGYERGKVRWLMWCGTGMHAHAVFWTGDHGFQTLHPADRSSGGDGA